MGTSRALAVPGLRTGVKSGWRADLATLAATLADHPRLLIPGILGFLLRGGIVFVTVPILVLPTSVEVRLLLGGNVDSTGLTPGFFVLVAAISGAIFAVALVAIYLIARCELASFTRFANPTQPSSEHVWAPPGGLAAAQRRQITTRLFVVDALALLAILMAALPLGAALGQATLAEILLPSSTESIYTRIATDVAAPLLFWIAVIVFIEAVSAIASRQVLAGAFGLRGHFRIHRSPMRAVAVAALGWLLFVGAVSLIHVGLSIAWQQVGSVFLSTGLTGDPRAVLGAVLVAVLLGLAFAMALFIGGLVSAVRAGLWTLASLR